MPSVTMNRLNSCLSLPTLLYSSRILQNRCLETMAVSNYICGNFMRCLPLSFLLSGDYSHKSTCAVFTSVNLITLEACQLCFSPVAFLWSLWNTLRENCKKCSFYFNGTPIRFDCDLKYQAHTRNQACCWDSADKTFSLLGSADGPAFVCSFQNLMADRGRDLSC